jgi:hypothetical protein
MVRPQRPRALFICGSLNQTTQMHQIAAALPEADAAFAPYYGDRHVTWLRQAGLLENTIGGDKLRGRALRYLEHHGLKVDLDGRRGGYDLVLTCSDLVVPRNVRGRPLVLVQEGVTDPDGWLACLLRCFPGVLPRWAAGTALTGLSGLYDRFCVASAGYRDHFVKRGAPPERVVVTGMPNFDDCRQLLQNDFPYSGYVLVCSSDLRETLRRDDRRAFLQRAVEIAGSRELFIKLHPNERVDRARREVERWAPRARLFVDGPTDQMIANCSELITQYSSVVFVALALNKPVHSYYPLEQLRRLLPDQHGRAAQNIAHECRKLLGLRRLGGASAIPRSSPPSRPRVQVATYERV